MSLLHFLVSLGLKCVFIIIVDELLLNLITYPKKKKNPPMEIFSLYLGSALSSFCGKSILNYCNMLI